ncbi:hypothetical protein FEM48_Zijuj01G0146300 [Ziziphus jujuba var. spinosa]|nr:hypothetical protein FEM48_Zijuj01G0146300 [Ziziphus jujuba var. spinosa]
MLISSGVVFMALAMKVSVPLVLEFVACHLPLIWSSFVSWLRPPYLFVIINGIIIIIAASSRFHHNQPETPSPPPKVSEDHGYEAKVRPEYGILEKPELAVYELREEKPSLSLYELRDEKGMVEYEEREEVTVKDVETAVVNDTVEDEDEEEEDFVISRTEWKPLRRSDSSEIILYPAEKPPVRARFGHRKPLKSSPEGGRALRVSKPKRLETLESTWKAITEGRSMPLSRHMKKCDTWENHGRQINLGLLDPSPAVKKSETFQDRTNQQLQGPGVTSSPGSGKLRKEPSLSQDELNRRVEAFIKKFNEEMRLQRQESLKQYMEMIDR